MTAVVTTLDVPAERCGTAVLDRNHGAPPRGRQRRTLPITENRAEEAEHVRHFQPSAGHRMGASVGHKIRRGWHEDVE